jgi:N-acetylglucosaminyldiphosphoundecaprenol N-acetyl-beta-D-mannosaminyltransferase
MRYGPRGGWLRHVPSVSTLSDDDNRFDLAGAKEALVVTIPIGPFEVYDGPADSLVREISASTAKVTIAFALHVGGLNHWKDLDYVRAMRSADFVYADGAAVVLLARLRGASRIKRSSTTDIGYPLLEALTRRLGRPARVAIIGGPVSLAERAGRALARAGGATIAYATHGYHPNWVPVLKQLNEARPDLVIVGMGMPLEAKWVAANMGAFPSDCVVLTCGGWLGFLAGDERRAPTWMQRLGAEWVARMMQAPSRLVPRYLRGMLTTLQLLPTQILRQDDERRSS